MIKSKELIDVLVENSTIKKIDGKLIYELDIEQYEKLLYSIKLHYNLVRDSKVDTIINMVLLHFNKELSAINKKTRKREIVIIRQTIYYLLNKYTKSTLQEMGAEFDQDHATALHGIRTITALMETRNRSVIEDVNAIENKLELKPILLKT